MSPKERTKTVEVPPNTGVDGFIHVVREIARLPRVQRIVVDRRGAVTYTQTLREDGQENVLNVNFDHLQPYHIIRGSKTQELSYPMSLGPSAVVAAMFDSVASMGMTPIAFVVGVATTLWSWIRFGDDVSLSSRDVFFGLPVYVDRQIPDTALVLCTGVENAESLVDTKFSLKVEMHNASYIVGEEVDVL